MDMYEQLVLLASKTKDYEIPIQQGAVWSLRTAPNALISSNTGFGKSFFTLYLVMMASIKNVIIFLADPKRSDLASLSNFMPSDRVAWETEKIAEMVSRVVCIMMERYGYMQTERLQRGLFQGDFIDFGLSPIFLVIEEMAAFVSSLERKSREAFESNIKAITLQGRQAGVNLCTIMQNPGTQNISTESRSQMGLRIYMGNSSGIEYKMIFGEGYTYGKRIYEPGQGLYMLAGKTERPEMFEAPRMDKCQLPAALKRALETQYDRNPYPPAPLRSQSEAGA